MGSSSDEASEISDSELDDYEAKAYHMLKTGNLRLRNPDGTFRCPFCAGKKKQDFRYKDLLQHTTGVGVSNARRGRQKAHHLAYARFLTSDLPEAAGPSQPAPADPDPHPPKPKPKPAVQDDDDDRFVWPWMGILVDVPPTGPVLEQQLAKFNPAEILRLSDSVDQCGRETAVVKFNKDWSGFKDAMAFENHFKSSHLGKKDWSTKESDGSSMYGWIARADDFNSENHIGEVLQRNGDLRTVSDVAKEESRETGKIVVILANQIEVKNKHLQDLEYRYNETTMSLRHVMEEKDKIHQNYNEQMRNMQLKARENARKIFQQNENLRLELDSKRKELELRSKELDNLEAQNDGERRKLDDEKQKTALENSSLELATIVQKKADEDVLKLVEDQKREKEEALSKILQLEKQLDQKQQLELEIEQLKGKLRVMKHLGGEDDTNLQEKMEALSEQLEEEKDHLETLNSTLLNKERQSNDELQDARKELITGLDDLLKGRTIIGIKRMGELDDKPFHYACKKKFQAEDADTKAAELVSSWQEELKNPAWHPFKIVESNGETQEVVDENDEKLKSLWIAMGDDVYNAVKTALLEMNEYNASGRYVVPELWNFKDSRKASMKEVVQYVLKQWKIYRRKK